MRWTTYLFALSLATAGPAVALAQGPAPPAGPASSRPPSQSNADRWPAAGGSERRGDDNPAELLGTTADRLQASRSPRGAVVPATFEEPAAEQPVSPSTGRAGNPSYGAAPAAESVPSTTRPPGEPGGSPAGTPITAAGRTGSAPRKGDAGRQTPLGASLSGRSARGDVAKSGGLTAMATVGGSLAAVLGLFLLVAWVMRKASPRSSSALPGEVFEVLGRASLVGRQQVYLLRCGRKLLLVSITPTGTETLTEVAEPEEVDRLAGLCRQAHPQSATAAFRQIFHQFAPRDPARAASREDELQDAGRRVGRAWEDDHV